MEAYLKNNWSRCSSLIAWHPGLNLFAGPLCCRSSAACVMHFAAKVHQRATPEGAHRQPCPRRWHPRQAHATTVQMRPGLRALQAVFHVFLSSCCWHAGPCSATSTRKSRSCQPEGEKNAQEPTGHARSALHRSQWALPVFSLQFMLQEPVGYSSVSFAFICMLHDILAHAWLNMKPSGIIPHSSS